MTRADWTSLRRELEGFRASGLRLPIWWRDDDATGSTPQLDRLAGLAQQFEMPVHLAIVPARACTDLEPMLSDGPFRPVVHGWAHVNHAPADRKSSEFGTLRPEAPAEAAKGLARLRELFGDKVHAMFVPPWNRIHPDLVPGLARAGYATLSTFGPREDAWAAPGLARINTHVDPVDWRASRGLADPDAIIGRLVAHLRARRDREADRSEPLGLLTHHLMMDEPAWTFCAALLEELRAGPVDIFDIAKTRSPA